MEENMSGYVVVAADVVVQAEAALLLSHHLLHSRSALRLPAAPLVL